MAKLSFLAINGWKSIDECELNLDSINLVIGANGAGKSNLIAFFGLLRNLVEERLQHFVAKSGGAHSIVHFGSDRLGGCLGFDAGIARYIYQFELERAAPDTLIIGEEAVGRPRTDWGDPLNYYSGAGLRESMLRANADFEPVASALGLLKQCRVFHFHDTSEAAAVRQSGYIEDNQSLGQDAGNLAAVLYRYQKTRHINYQNIRSTVGKAFPGFDDFVLTPRSLDEQSIFLNWRRRDSEYLFGPHQFSDGTIRFVALTTLLLQPRESRPDLILIDEPELGLHPFAIGLLAEMIRAASIDSQIILTTQSAALVDHFTPEDIIVADLDRGRTRLTRLDRDSLSEWLENYSLGELWEKNVIGGGPVR